MTDTPCDADGRSDVEVLIMEATYRALREHGYAKLSIAQIADEFEKSKSLLYYHYDSKDDLIAAFLAFAIDRFVADIEAATQGARPLATIRTLVDHLLAVDDEEMLDGQRTIVELRGQAVSELRFHDQFSRIDDRLRERIRAALVAGIEAGEIDDAIDPDETATWLYATLTGTMTQRHTAARDTAEPVRTAIHRHLDRLVTEP